MCSCVPVSLSSLVFLFLYPPRTRCMPTPLIECIPNFSEGRRPAVVEAIVAVIRAVPGIRVLHVTSDADHNRSVVTFAGATGAVEEAAFRAVAQAAQLINLDDHTGQ